MNRITARLFVSWTNAHEAFDWKLALLGLARPLSLTDGLHHESATLATHAAIRAAELLSVTIISTGGTNLSGKERQSLANMVADGKLPTED